MAEPAQNVHAPGAEVFTVRKEKVEARTDAIADAWSKEGLLTIVHEQPLADGMVKVTCIAFNPGQPEAAKAVMQELGISSQDVTAIKSPQEGQAAPELDF